MTVGEKIRAMRKAAKLRQEDLAQLAGGHPQKWVSGRERDVTGTTTLEIELLARLTGHRAEIVIVPEADSDLIESLGNLDPEGTRTALRLAKLWPDLDDLLRRILINTVEQIEREQRESASKRA